MRPRSVVAALIAAAAVVTAPAAVAAPPRATTVPCGAVLTSSVRLAVDVVCPTGGGITLAADGVELNLNGHALVGPGRDTDTVGVEVAARDVVVRNGTVRDWGAAVRGGIEEGDQDAEPVVTGVVRDARLVDNETGAFARTESALTVRTSRISGHRSGVVAQLGGRVRVESSTVERNGSGVSSFQVPPGGVVVRDSLIRENGSGVVCGQDGRYDVARSTLQRNGIGLDLFECHGRVVDSRFVWNGEHVAGFLVEGDVIVLRCNTYTRDGLPLPFPTTPCR
ncbi:hypothetical protein FHR75_003304 [Kineococcus radiotolerans]|uniref:Right handed beta helix domain-containing protein n=1 Tax=Kineococcus radiotolerans TaxID=131568 RepID=A0A7W4TPU8_KINRA|nr:right-handed parallel beta-helix repeat-containing protein [Kineococcus radiotolerans]MBB2902473.1 hypothetical protein [Kineococcus radiotolerans]